MINLFNYDQDLISGLVRQFTQSCFPGTTADFACIHRSEEFPDERQVFVVAVANRQFALKVYLRPQDAGKLEAEFQTLRQLADHFLNQDRVGTIAPVFLSPDGKFLVTEYLDHKTAGAIIRSNVPDNQAAQIFRRAGQWLHVLHSLQPATKGRLWSGWMFEELGNLIATTELSAVPSDYEQMISQMQRDADHLGDVRDQKVFSHGDFNAENLLIGDGMAFGLDLADAHEKLAIYDIVDFMKSDVLRDWQGGSVDRSGLMEKSKTMFFKLYRHPVDMDAFDFCMRGRLLIEWLKISQEICERSPYQRRKASRLRDRLVVAFQHAI